MGSLKKRSTAILVAVIVIVLGTLFGVHRSVNKETAKIEASFYNGVYLKDEKYTQPSIDSQLQKRADAALGLLSVANQYPFLSDSAGELRAAREELLGAKSIADKYAANVKLESAYKHIYDTLKAQAEGVPASAESYAATLSGAEGIIEKSDYNKSVSAFRNGTLSGFPVNILKKLAFVRNPEYFGA